jgi:hypothetical protein
VSDWKPREWEPPEWTPSGSTEPVAEPAPEPAAPAPEPEPAPEPDPEPAPPPTPASAPYVAPAPAPYGPPAPAPYGPPVGYPTIPELAPARSAFVVGIVALVFTGLGLLTCMILSPLAVIFGIWAWVAGQGAVREVGLHPGVYRNASQASTGRVLGVVATVIGSVELLALVAIFAVP